MSIEFLIDSIDDENVKKISKELEVEIKNRYQSFFAPKKYLVLYRMDDEKIRLPMHYAFLLFNKKVKGEYPKITCNFQGELRGEQVEVKNEIISLFNKRRFVSNI